MPALSAASIPNGEFSTTLLLRTSNSFFAMLWAMATYLVNKCNIRRHIYLSKRTRRYIDEDSINSSSSKSSSLGSSDICCLKHSCNQIYIISILVKQSMSVKSQNGNGDYDVCSTDLGWFIFKLRADFSVNPTDAI
jgi:hypothetical protein